MNSRMKILILVLLTAVLCLSVAVASHTMSDADLPEQSAQTAEPKREQTAELFIENGSWGVRTPGGRVLVQPQWQHLRIMNDDVLIAYRQTKDGSRCGLIRMNGELLVPLIYSDFTRKAEDLWIAEFLENGQTRSHIYHDDGTRWTDVAWEICEPDGDTLLLGRNGDTVRNTLRGGRLIRTAWHSEHKIGLHRLIMDLDEVQLAAAPDPETLTRLGDAAAAYLTYLMIDDSTLDPALFSGEDTASLAAAGRYRKCFLQEARVTRLKMKESAGFPTYFLQIGVTYRRDGADGSSEDIRTAMYLTVSRNAAGAYTYSGFSDAQLDAAGTAR
ncbi:MAG: hypothetical protein K6E36_04230 [Oscillospiraceae bacterium]|nr:hypothetical protein [Oscillospiraceae bacterium]MCR5305688.1 hypothetical protein [Oscillospiraceae bacterium]